MASSSQRRRPLDLARLNERAARWKLRSGITFPDATKKMLTVPREAFVPVFQAEVGSSVSLVVYRYRILVPIAQIGGNVAGKERRFRIAKDDDVFKLRDTLIEHFGGLTIVHQPPAPAFGVGARDPANVTATLEQNEHIAFEVYAAPVQEADDYFRALRLELEDALQEGVILIERQQVVLI